MRSVVRLSRRTRRLHLVDLCNDVIFDEAPSIISR